MDANLGEMLDTSPEYRRRYYELLRRLTPEQRARKTAGLCRAVRNMAVAGIQRAHPNASPEEIAWRLAARLYGEETAAKMFPGRCFEAE